jgi:hypothetical protein
MVRIGRIQVVNALVDGMTHHPDGFRFIDVRIPGSRFVGRGASADYRQTHGAETQGRNFPIQFSEFSKFHPTSCTVKDSSILFFSLKSIGFGKEKE